MNRDHPPDRPSRPERSLRAGFCAALALALSLLSAPAFAAQPDLPATAEACTTAKGDFTAFIARLGELGWTRVAAPDLSDADIVLLNFSTLPSRLAPSERRPALWKQGWELGLLTSGGLRRLKPADGPKLYRAFLTGTDAVLRADRLLPGGPLGKTVCTITVAGPPAATLAEDLAGKTAAEVDVAETLVRRTDSGSSGLSLYRPSAVSDLTGNDILEADPDLVATYLISSDINTEQVKQ